mmetsp:Transcript_326/g.33  ORF Transcript_326/g.33 Transcript_326/m.33 type:complete len:152 (+) Transcript_326:681-1136(+)
MLSISIVLFIAAGIQFWGTDFATHILNMDPMEAYSSYAGVIIIGPTLGTGVGGLVVHKLGGYREPKALLSCFIFYSIGAICGIILQFIRNPYAWMSVLGTLLFFGAMTMPTLIGTMISSVPKKLKYMASSFGTLMYTIIGYLPSPFLYSVI